MLPPSPMSFVVRRATDADRPLILATLAEYLPDTDPQQRYDWLYLDNPHGRALTWLVLEEATGTVAGMTSFFLRRMVANGTPLRGALGGDGYVRPAFRRRGLGQRMHQASRDDMTAAQIAVMFGTPMPANLTPLQKVGTTNIDDTIRYVRPLTAPRLGPLSRVVSPLLRLGVGDARLEPMRELDPRTDEVWQRTLPELGIATVRDAAFYTWRFVRSPSQRQVAHVILAGREPIAVCALEEITDGHVRVVDLVAPAAEWGRAISAIVRAVPRATALELKLVRADGDARALWRYGFLARGEKPLNIMLPPGSPSDRRLLDPARWFFTWADSDMDHD